MERRSKGESRPISLLQSRGQGSQQVSVCGGNVVDRVVVIVVVVVVVVVGDQ